MTRNSPPPPRSTGCWSGKDINDKWVGHRFAHWLRKVLISAKAFQTPKSIKTISYPMTSYARLSASLCYFWQCSWDLVLHEQKGRDGQFTRRVQTAWPLLVERPWLALERPFLPFWHKQTQVQAVLPCIWPPFLAFTARFSAMPGWHFPDSLDRKFIHWWVWLESCMIVLKNAEISSRRSLKPNIPREPKLGYVLWLQRLKMMWKCWGWERVKSLLYIVIIGLTVFIT